MPDSSLRKTCKGKGGLERREGDKLGKSVIVFLRPRERTISRRVTSQPQKLLRGPAKRSLARFWT